jgi:hydroxymethylbilane synthase
LRELEGSGYFTKELEEALLRGEIDLAVHSYKDMPSACLAGLAVAAVSEREDPADLLIIRPAKFQGAKGLIPLRNGAIVGTSAVRRETQVKALRRDLHTKDLRGNVPTRLQKLRDTHYDAIFLAAAGVRRLGLDLAEFVVVRLDPEQFVPAPGQGALAVQMRADDARLAAVRRVLHNEDASIATQIEREVQAKFGGGCGLPLGAHARREDDTWWLYGFWAPPQGKPIWATTESTSYPLLADELYFKLAEDESCPIAY